MLTITYRCDVCGEHIGDGAKVERGDSSIKIGVSPEQHACLTCQIAVREFMRAYRKGT